MGLGKPSKIGVPDKGKDYIGEIHQQKNETNYLKRYIRHVYLSCESHHVRLGTVYLGKTG